MKKEIHDLAEILREIPTNRKIICIEGPLASGKTFTMSALAEELHQAFGTPVYCNYDLYCGIDIKDLSHMDIHGTQKPFIFCIDEGESAFSFSPTFMAYMFSEAMEDKQIIFMFTSFKKHRIPGEYRDGVNVYLEAEKTGPETITLKQTNGSYSREFKIEPEKETYNAFVPTEYRF